MNLQFVKVIRWKQEKSASLKICIKICIWVHKGSLMHMWSEGKPVWSGPRKELL